jgi:hypothetical protein
MNYRCTIENNEGKQIANIQFKLGDGKLTNAVNDERAKNLMNEFLKLVAINNFFQPKDCNTNLFREKLVNGI